MVLVQLQCTAWLPLRYRRTALSQDRIGWTGFLEGMISKEIVELHRGLRRIAREESQNTGIVEVFLVATPRITRGSNP